MADENRILIIANPISGGGRAAKLVEAVKQGCKGARGLSEHCLAGDPSTWPVVQTTVDDAWKTEVRAWVKTRGVQNVMVVGGDGTLMQVAQLFYELKEESPSMVIVPGGRGNDFARALYGYSLRDGDFWEWIEARVAPGRKRWGQKQIDLGSANGKLFINMASVGYGGRVVENAHSRKAFWSKSSLVYQVEGALALTDGRKCVCEVKADGTTVYQGPFFGAFVGNGKANGSGLFWTRDANLDDGLLDGIAFPKPGVLEMMRVMNAVKSDEAPARGLPFSHRLFRGAELTFHFDQPTALELDGDFAGDAMSHGFKCLPGALKVTLLKH